MNPMPALPPVDPAVFLWFLPLTLPVALYVAWSDMARMRIPNAASWAMAATWAVSPLILPWEYVVWGLALMGAVLAVGFLLNAVGAVGGGDAKFAAGMAAQFTGADLRVVFALWAACLIGAFVAHRLLRAIPAVRAALPGWKSWTHAKFPMGLALAGTVIFHPLLALILP